MLRFILPCIALLLSISVWTQEDINPNGFNTFYYPNGAKLSEGYMLHGKPEGYWRSYHATGVLKSEGNRRNHILDSVWIFYNSLGDTISKISYLQGKKNGYSYTYYIDASNPGVTGRVKAKELYVNNRLEGLSFYYYDNGNLKSEIPFVDNKEEGRAYNYSEDGRLIEILQYRKGDVTDRERINRYNAEGKRHGRWLEFYTKERIKQEITYQNGEYHGYYKEYNPDGTLALTLLYEMGKLVTADIEENDPTLIQTTKDKRGNTVQGSYQGKLKVGVHRTISGEGKVLSSEVYDLNGVLISSGIITAEGSREGDWKLFYPSGKVKASGKYLNNTKEGKWSYYFENGSVEQVGTYRKGREEGEWIRFFADGEVQAVEYFYYGKEDGEYVEYNELGEIITQGEYIEGEKEGKWLLDINDFKAEGTFITGLKDGKWKHYYDNGALMYEGNYIQGNAVGKHKYYYPDGNLKEEQYFSSGIPDKHWKKYNELGELIVTITYEKGKEVRINGEKIEFPDDIKVIVE